MGVADPTLNYQNFVYLYSAFFKKIMPDKFANSKILLYLCTCFRSKEQGAKNKDLLP